MADVLIVEDDDDIRESLAELLNDEGFSTEQAAHGAEALALLERGAARLILLDLMMPVMNGWELMRELAKRPELASIPVVIVSATASAVPTTAVALLRKPLDVKRLIDTLRAQLG